jgi:hypothetical protein
VRRKYPKYAIPLGRLGLQRSGSQELPFWAMNKTVNFYQAFQNQQAKDDPMGERGHFAQNFPPKKEQPHKCTRNRGSYLEARVCNPSQWRSGAFMLPISFIPLSLGVTCI